MPNRHFRDHGPHYIGGTYIVKGAWNSNQVLVRYAPTYSEAAFLCKPKLCGRGYHLNGMPGVLSVAGQMQPCEWNQDKI